VHELNAFVLLRTRLKRLLTRRTTRRTTDARRTTDTPRRSDNARHTDHKLHRATTSISSAFSMRAVELTREIIKKHVATNNLCLTDNIGGALRAWLREAAEEDKRSVPNELIGAAYAMTLRTVKHDIFPRFRNSSHFEKLLYGHLARTLQHDAFREAFQAELTPLQLQALTFYHGARAFEQSCEAEPPDVLKLKMFCDRYDAELAACCAEQHDALKRSLDAMTRRSAQPEGPMLTGCINACSNLLFAPYVEFLASNKSQRLQREIGVGGIDLSHCHDHGCDHSCDGYNDKAAEEDHSDDDYAAGW